MIKLPNNLVTASLALLLGIVMGIGSCYLFSFFNGGSSSSQLGMKRDGLWVREMERFIQKQDTANQESPDVEIRYKTRTDTIRDTVTVAVPSSLSEDPIVSDRTPLNITENVVEHTYWDPLDRRFETRKYNIPEDNFSVGLYGSVRVQSEGLQVPIGADRIYFGPSLEVEYNRFSTSLSVYTTPLLSDQYVELMLRYEIF